MMIRRLMESTIAPSDIEFYLITKESIIYSAHSKKYFNYNSIDRNLDLTYFSFQEFSLAFDPAWRLERTW